MKEDVLKNIEIALKMKRDNFTVKEISEKMNRPVGTIKRWLAPYQLKASSEVIKANALKASLKMQENYALKRKKVYEKTLLTAKEDLKDERLRDFINIYIGEGSKRAKNDFAITNTDLDTILLSLTVIKNNFLKDNKKITLSISYYKENNNEKELLEFWNNLIGENKYVEIKSYIQPTVKAIGHNNSNKYGLVEVAIHDVYAREKLNAYMDYIKLEWNKDFRKIFN